MSAVVDSRVWFEIDHAQVRLGERGSGTEGTFWPGDLVVENVGFRRSSYFTSCRLPTFVTVRNDSIVVLWSL